MNNIPRNACTITYQTERGSKVIYFIWPHANKWQWSALGNCGEAETFQQASDAARDWIRGLN